MNDLLKKGAKWFWSKECEDALQKIKIYLLSDLSLAHFDAKKEIIVMSNASNLGIRAVIFRKFEDGTTMSIAHVFRTLLLTERLL